MECASGAGARLRRSSIIDRSHLPSSGRAQDPRPCAMAAGVSGSSDGLPRCRPALPRIGLRDAAIVALVTAITCACATPQATDIGGRWRPVNRFADAPQAIPLQQAYVYQASPADGTLKTMLGRWARDARVTLSYQHPNDYTLHGPVGGIQTTSLEQAAAALSIAYAGQGVLVQLVDGSRIVVSQRAPGAIGTAGQDG